MGTKPATTNPVGNKAEEVRLRIPRRKARHPSILNREVGAMRLDSYGLRGTEEPGIT